jgi:YD repeat-containing protein
MAANGTWTADVYVQKFLLDRWGNRQLDATSTGAINKRQFAVNTATNRLSVPAGQNGQMSYDAAGFLTTDTWTDPASQAVSRVYDAPGRMTTAKNSASNDIARYTYDADGHRTRYRREISGCAAQGSGRWVRAG